jgi:hypothetical protein
MYYAFTPGTLREKPRQTEWKGEVELRGLANRSYRVADYVNGMDFGTVTGPTANSKSIHGEAARSQLIKFTDELSSQEKRCRALSREMLPCRPAASWKARR